MNNKPLDQQLFNIDILILNKNNVGNLQEVRKATVFETGTQSFEQEGLFSTNIFGPVGSDIRNTQPAYIDLQFSILHPLIYEHITSLKSYYKDIIEGKSFAKFDKDVNDFILTTDETGDTGYTFFIEHIDKLVFEENDSEQRSFKIKLVKKYGNKESMISKWLVLPAGMRDYTVDENNQPSEDEINGLYRKLLSTVAMVKNTKIDTNIKLLDPVRLKIQKTCIEIFEYIKTLLDGKNKFIQGKWAKRAIVNGTRNVLTPTPTKTLNLEDENKITSNHSVIGLYQYIKGISPIAMNKVHTLFINKFLNPNSDNATLVNPDNMKTEIVTIPIKKRDEWLSLEGLSGVMNKLSQEDLRIEPVKIDKYYLMLLYDNGKEIILFNSTDQITDDLDRKYIRPITYAELFYIAIYEIKDKYPCFITRYPVAGLGGIYPSKVYVKTTYNARTISLLKDGVSKTVYEYPKLNDEFVTSVSVSPVHIGRLGADFDGDFSI